MARCFEIHVQEDCKDWIDYNLFRHALHDVTITYYRDSGTWDGVIRLAKTAEADFGEGRQIPGPIIQKLAALVIHSCA